MSGPASPRARERGHPGLALRDRRRRRALERRRADDVLVRRQKLDDQDGQSPRRRDHRRPCPRLTLRDCREGVARAGRRRPHEGAVRRAQAAGDGRSAEPRNDRCGSTCPSRRLLFGLDFIVPIAEPQDAIAKRFLISNWFTTRAWLERNPEPARRLVAAAYETARWANTHHADTLLILAKYAKLDVSRLQTMKRATYATSLDARLMQPGTRRSFQFGALPRRLNAVDLLR